MGGQGVGSSRPGFLKGDKEQSNLHSTTANSQPSVANGKGAENGGIGSFAKGKGEVGCFNKGHTYSAPPSQWTADSWSASQYGAKGKGGSDPVWDSQCGKNSGCNAKGGKAGLPWSAAPAGDWNNDSGWKGANPWSTGESWSKGQIPNQM